MFCRLALKTSVRLSHQNTFIELFRVIALLIT